MGKWNILLAGILILLVVMVVTPHLSQAAQIQPTPTTIAVTKADKAALEMALRTASQSNQKFIPAFLLYQPAIDQVEMAADGKTALVWMALIDPQTQQPVATEPGLAVAKRANANSPWQITLPTEKDWGTVVQSLPDTLMNKQRKSFFADTAQETKSLVAANQVFTGYFLPWEGGKRVWLTGSVAHFTTYNSCSWITANGDTHSTCRYAFDFSDGSEFRILAARGGTVIGSRWTCVDSDHNCLNYIALEDRTTNPVTTALYLHLAQNSIPTALRTNGTYVNQGDFVALADNTGMSTGHHLHFMVVANRWMGSGYGGGFWWGDSVDITFNEVEINGGRPRLCSEARYTPQYGTQCHPANNSVGEPIDNWFISGNKGSNQPPTAKMTAPSAFSYVASPSVTVSGSATDNSGVARIQVIANYDNNWVEVGPAITTNPFTASVDMCSAGIPNGPVTLALWAWDVDGNRSPLPQNPQPIYKNAVCPPPTPKCAPDANQVALFALPDYQGACQVLGVGKYGSSQLNGVGDNQTSSIMVGANVEGILYQDNYENGVLKGRSEAFLSNDPGLADNRIGVKTTSSVEVKARVKPDAPLLRTPLNQLDASSNPLGFTSNDSILLTWKSDNNSFPADEGGTDYRAELTLPEGTRRSTAWQTANTWSIGSLPAGSYRWTVTARNLLGETTAAPATFSVAAAAALAGTPKSVPFSDDFESGTNGWTARGLWHQATPPAGNTSKAWGFNNNGSYADGLIAGGELTSPPIAVPAGGAILKFRYLSQTEDNGPFWDQRRVQISANGGPFQDVLQLSDDAMSEWLNSPSIDLAPYAGKTILVRFYFHIVDKLNNVYAGWWIDDFNVSAGGGDAACAETVKNDTAANATPMALNQSISATICPAGDVDYYSFSAAAGTTITADVVAKAEGSALDPYLTLIDGDGKSVLAENDDIQYAVQQDSRITFTLSRSGTYYLKVKAYGHPGAGGANYTYRIVLNGDVQAPVVYFTNPYKYWVAATAFDVKANARDANGVSRVDFYWHNSDWLNGSWELLGSDTTPLDGWLAHFDPTGRVVPGSALLARAYDPAGQMGATVVWNLQTDTIPPVTRLQALPSSLQSSVVALSWTGSDVGAGIYQFGFQYKDGSGAWTDWPNTVPGNQTTANFQGTAGHSYSFRMRAEDFAGNIGSFPANAEASTTLAATCSPDGYDAAAGGDNTAATAVNLTLGKSQDHNFCPAGDIDWLKFTAKAGVTYLVSAASTQGGAAVDMAVMDADGLVVLQQAKAAQPGQSLTMNFTAPADGEYKVRIQPYDARLMGSAVHYSAEVAQGIWYYLPVIGN